jgi:RNA polymerase sigma factor (sigma-70 family)
MATARQDASDAITGAGIAGESCDEALVAGLRSGNHDAFEEFVAVYQTSIFNLALRILQHREDARDVAQEVFLKAFRQLPNQHGDLRLRPWIYRVTVNACYDHMRSCRRRPLPGDSDVELREEPVDQVEQAELARLFRDSLRTLPPRQQIALLLKDVHGLPHSEIAESLGISRGSAEVLLFRARHSFRRTFTSLTAEPERAAVCTFADRMAAEAVGGRLTDARRRRILQHAEHCPDCHSTVKGWSGAVVGLGIALPLVAVELFHTSSAAAAIAGLASASSAVAVGSAAGAAGAALLASASGSAVGASAAACGAAAGAAALAAPTVSAGLLAKISALLTAKAVTVAAATTCVLTAGTVTAYEAQQAPGKQPGPTVAAAVAQGLTTKPANAPASARRSPQGTGGSSASSAGPTAIAVVHIKATGTVHDQASRIPSASAGTGARHPGTTPVPHLRIPVAGHVHNQAMRIQNGRRHPRPAPTPGDGAWRHQRPLPQGPQSPRPPVTRPAAPLLHQYPLQRKVSDRAAQRSSKRADRVQANGDVLRLRAREDGRQPRAGDGAGQPRSRTTPKGQGRAPEPTPGLSEKRE